MIEKTVIEKSLDDIALDFSRSLQGLLQPHEKIQQTRVKKQCPICEGKVYLYGKNCKGCQGELFIHEPPKRPILYIGTRQLFIEVLGLHQFKCMSQVHDLDKEMTFEEIKEMLV